MSDTTADPSPKISTNAISWLFATVLAIHSLLGVILPRLEKESALREAGRGWHYLLGMAAAVLAAWLIIRWRRGGSPVLPGTLPPALRGWTRSLALVFVIVPLLAVPLGFLNAWGEGRIVHLAQVLDLPTLMDRNRAVWQFTGYFHSVLGNVLVQVGLVGLLTAGYTYLRYGKGLLTAFAPGFGPLILIKSTLFIYAINSFRERRPGYIAAAIVLAIVGVVWLIGRRRAAASAGFEPGAPGRLSLSIGAAAIAGISTFAAFMPYLLFKVTPIATGVAISADPDITWHVDRVPGYVVTAETEFERTKGMETYKWCEFCHTVSAGAKPLVGPNLHNIFGQRAGTVPNFYYSAAMAKKGREGLTWDDRTIGEFIADPQHFIPGTSMQISSGPVSDPQVRAAVIAILKRRTLNNVTSESSKSD